MADFSRPRLWLAGAGLLAAAICLVSFSRPAEGGCGPKPAPDSQAGPLAPGGCPAPQTAQAAGSPVSSTTLSTTYSPPASYISPAPLPPVTTTPTLDQLLDGLARINAQKEELARQEKALVEKIKEKLGQQQERLKKLGVPVPRGTLPEPATPVPPATVTPSSGLPF